MSQVIYKHLNRMFFKLSVLSNRKNNIITRLENLKVNLKINLLNKKSSSSFKTYPVSKKINVIEIALSVELYCHVNP